MKLDDSAQAVLDLIREMGRPPMETLSPAEAREVFVRSRAVLQPEPQEVGGVAELAAPGPAGVIKLRAYRPAGTAADAVLPALVYYHGGGWVVGNLDSHDTICRHLANAAGCRVISVDYRLAPEHVFPAAVDDAMAALRWVAAQAGSLGIDPARIAVGGDSAGGNLATVVALAARDAAWPPLAAQILVYPVTDFSFSQDSYARVTEGPPLTTASMVWFREHYLPRPEHRADWRASPLRAASLAGLPPAFVALAWHDPLFDEGLEYAKRLESEGVEVTLRRYDGQIHGFLAMGRLVPEGLELAEAAAAALRRAFGTAAG
jgi:acetyl esterase